MSAALVLFSINLIGCATSFTQNNIDKLRIGMNAGEVRMIFGAPDEVRTAVCGGNTPTGQWICETWTYRNSSRSSLTFSVNQDEKKLNKQINSKSKNAVESINQTLDITENSPLKLNAPMSELGGGLLSSRAENENTNTVPEKKLPPSGDKNSSYGNNDFWVVKLVDTTKPEKVKMKIEALPNPSYGFTNVIIGYEFQKGTATVVDLSGKQLQQFEITSRTVPVDLSSYPEGIYIVNIKTEVSNDGVKVIKGISKN